MALYEQVFSPITGENGEESVVSHWIRWSSESPGSRGTRLPDDAHELGFVKAIAEHCGVRKVRRDMDGSYTPVTENVRNYTPPVPLEPLSDGAEALLIGGLFVTALAVGVALLASTDSSAADEAAKEKTEDTEARQREHQEAAVKVATEMYSAGTKKPQVSARADKAYS